MPQIIFNGHAYNNEFEMPADILRAYRESEKRKTGAKQLTDVVDIPEEIKGIYERAVVKTEEQSVSSQPMSELPTTEELFQRSAPQEMKHLPSDERIFQPSPPVIDPANSTIEPDAGIRMRSLAAGVLWVLLVIVVIILVTRFLW